MTGRRQLVRDLAQVIRDERVLQAIAEVPREAFVPAAHGHRAYENVALPIACEQTISQPLVVARMLELLELRPVDRVLDVGTGSGYHAAVLARLAAHVWSIERFAELSRTAEAALAQAGVENVTVTVGDGRRGLVAEAPFDAINVAAAAGEDPPAELVEQLAPGGRLVAPVGTVEQRLVLVRRSPDGTSVQRATFEAVRFVPLVRVEPTGAES